MPQLEVDEATRDEVCAWMIAVGLDPRLIIDGPGELRVMPLSEGRLEVVYSEVVPRGPRPALPTSWPPADMRDRSYWNAEWGPDGNIAKTDQKLVVSEAPPGYLWDGDLVWDAWAYLRRIPKTNLPKEAIS